MGGTERATQMFALREEIDPGIAIGSRFRIGHVIDTKVWSTMVLLGVAVFGALFLGLWLARRGKPQRTAPLAVGDPLAELEAQHARGEISAVELKLRKAMHGQMLGQMPPTLAAATAAQTEPASAVDQVLEELLLRSAPPTPEESLRYLRAVAQAIHKLQRRR
jgi:hypothetical protein